MGRSGNGELAATRFHGVELLCRIATRVDFSGRQIGVPQPQRQLTDVLCCLEDDHRACVPEYVWRDAFLAEAGIRPRGIITLTEQRGSSIMLPADGVVHASSR
jgi:hypothetical protein